VKNSCWRLQDFRATGKQHNWSKTTNLCWKAQKILWVSTTTEWQRLTLPVITGVSSLCCILNFTIFKAKGIGKAKSKGKVTGKGKVQSRTGHEGAEREYRSSSTLSLTSMLDGVGGQRDDLATLPPRKRPGTHCIGGCEGRSRQVRKISPPWIRSPDLSARSESLYRLNYRGPHCKSVSQNTSLFKRDLGLIWRFYFRFLSL